MQNLQELKKLEVVIAHYGGLGVEASRLSVWPVLFSQSYWLNSLTTPY